jgi:hypothetical protein
MSNKKLKEKIGLGGYTVQPLNHGNSLGTFPVEATNRNLNEEEATV